MKNFGERSRRISVATLLMMLVITVVGQTGTAGAAGQADLATVRAATAQFHDVGNAPDAGYFPLLPCFESPEGGMGQHLVNVELLDTHLDPLRPEALVYEVRKSGLKFGAVEYIVPKAAWTQEQPPSLLGETFRSNDELGLWVLHAWIWQPNPDGMFENFNPNIGACPNA
ncbi:MAG: hypothetical protein WEB06_01455 [Actinomycetota bacterium]